MSLILKRDPVWLQCLPPPDASATLLLLGGDGQQVAVPAALLLAASPVVRSILTDHLPPAYSPCCLSLPATTGDVLQVFGDILATGAAAGAHEDKIEEVQQVFEMMEVDAWIVKCHLESIHLEQVLEKDIKLECFDEESGTNLDEENICQFEGMVKLETDVVEAVCQLPPLNLTKNLEQNQTIGIPYNSCTQKFRQKPSLQNYCIDSVHKKIEYTCNHCTHNFSDKSCLKRHIDSVHKKIEYTCKDCTLKYSDVSNLNRHINSVHKKLKYACNHCTHKCSYKSNLKKHINSVHKKIKYQCSFCPQKFSLKQNLVRHTARVHPDDKINGVVKISEDWKGENTTD